jgi:hypothetical protein
MNNGSIHLSIECPGSVAILRSSSFAYVTDLLVDAVSGMTSGSEVIGLRKVGELLCFLRHFCLGSHGSLKGISLLFA